MKREIITTADGSKTIRITDWNEQYHSVHGAIQEAYHVFIKNGLSLFHDRNLSILEIGFGTGLNAFITLLESIKYRLDIDYKGVEAYPVAEGEWGQLDYMTDLHAVDQGLSFLEMHQIPWERSFKIADNFRLWKQKKDFKDISDIAEYDLIYFDAFGFRVQPELWTERMFNTMYQALRPNGILVTYAA
ncbi:MAG TPA: tRNA (5-methylaminomethyl-2-thiouridine)(34)-methyltransferase MnmD, partial [Arenibacter sp.]|nr:tRNA (5-methylaminomethyl-2-thiouridine)(34)-methyltransferase MnmD [Arenibacter sp.]